MRLVADEGAEQIARETAAQANDLGRLKILRRLLAAALCHPRLAIRDDRGHLSK